MAAIRHEVGSGVHGCLLVVVNKFAPRLKGMHVDLGLSKILALLRHRGTELVYRSARGSEQRISGEGDLGAVGRHRWKRSNGLIRSELLLLGAVVIHGPDLFVAAAAIGYE